VSAVARLSSATLYGDVLFGADDMVKLIVMRGLGQMTDPEEFGPSAALGIVRKGKIIGGIVYNEFTGWSCAVTTYVDGKSGPGWCSPATLCTLYTYPFCQLNCTRIEALVSRQNRSTRRILKHMGWTEEGCHPLRYNGTDDAISYGMLRQNCRWLKENQKDG
jgi:RimJ/RimL family protein N-acetyltransferase